MFYPGTISRTHTELMPFQVNIAPEIAIDSKKTLPLEQGL
jgi:hypothetical protein